MLSWWSHDNSCLTCNCHVIVCLECFWLLWACKYIQCTDLACHASLQVRPDLIACLPWIPCLRARISVPARVPTEWSSPPLLLFRYFELFCSLHRATVAGVVSSCRCNLCTQIDCNKELVCSMLSSVVFQKTSPRSLGWNTGHSGFPEPGCHNTSPWFGPRGRHWEVISNKCK